MRPLSPAADAIISSLAFFALFSRPLESEEIVRYAYVSEVELTEEEIRKELAAPSIYWYQVHGYYYLETAKYTRSIKSMQQTSNDFLCKARKYLPLLRHVPYVRFVGIANTVAFSSATADSDIDLFIVTKKNKVWVCRLFVTVLLHLLGVRRHGNKVKGRFCLSFFVDESALGLADISLKPMDTYLSFWLATIVPVWKSETYDALIYQNRPQLLGYFPFWHKHEPLCSLPSSKLRQGLEAILSFSLFVWIGKSLVYLQKKKMQKLPVPQNEFSSVIVTDHMLKFHNNDRRSRYQVAWETLCTSVISKV